MRRHIGWIIISVIVIGAIAWGFYPRPVEVSAAKVASGPLEVTLEEYGKTRVRDRFVLSAPVAGYAQRIDLEVGDPVEAGQVVAVLEPLPSQALDPRSRAEQEARVAAARSHLNATEQNVRAARADYEYAQRELERREKLRIAGTISAGELEQAQVQFKRAEASLRSAQAAVEVARYELEAAQSALKVYTTDSPDKLVEITVKAPVAGQVLAVHQKSAGVVQAGQPLVDIGDPRRLEVVVEMLSTEAVRVSQDTPVRLLRWGGPALDGRVRTVEPTGFTKISALGVEEQRVQVIADITSPPEQWERLGDGYRVEAHFIVWQGDDVLQMPDSALFRKGEQWAVFKVVDGEAQTATVEIGQSNGLSTQVLGGLSAGDIVITHPDDRISDGASVEPKLSE